MFLPDAPARTMPPEMLIDGVALACSLEVASLVAADVTAYARAGVPASQVWKLRWNSQKHWPEKPNT